MEIGRLAFGNEERRLAFGNEEHWVCGSRALARVKLGQDHEEAGRECPGRTRVQAVVMLPGERDRSGETAVEIASARDSQAAEIG